MRCLFYKHATKRECWQTGYCKSLAYGRCGCDFKCIMFDSAHQPHLELSSNNAQETLPGRHWRVGTPVELSEQKNYQSSKITIMYLHRRWNWHTFYTLNNANRLRNLNLNHQEPNEIKKKMRLSVHSVVLSCHLFLWPFTLSHSK